MKLKPFIAAIAVTFAFASCAGPQNPLATLVPSDALFFAQIENPKAQMTNLDQFVKPLGLESVTKGKSAQEMLTEFAKKSNGVVDPLWFDFEKPIGLSVLPNAKADEAPAVLVYLPLVEAEKNFPNITAMAEKMGNTKAVKYQNYAILTLGDAVAPAFPVAKSIDFSLLSSYEKGGISYYLDFKGLKSILKYEPAAVLEMLNSSMDSMDKLSAPEQIAMTKEMLTAVVDLVTQSSLMTASLVTDATGLKSKGTFEFVKDGTVMKWIQGVSPVKGTKDLLKYLPADSIFNVAINIPEETIKKVSKDIMSWSLKYMSLDAAKIEEQNKLFQPLIDLQGGRMTMSFDFDYDMSVIQQMSSSSAKAEIEKAFSLTGIVVSELKDGKAYEQAIKAYYSSPLWKEILASTLEKSNLPLDLDLVYAGEQKDADFAYSTIKISATLKPSANVYDAMPGTETIEALMNKFTFFMHFTNNKMYMVIGDKGLEILKALVKKDGVEVSLADSKSIKTLEAFAPDDANLFGNLSIRRVAQLVAKAGFPGSQMIPQLTEDSPGLFGYTKLANGRVEFGTAWSIKELSEIGKAVGGFLPLLMGGGF